jgi:hypothetical protein
VASNRSARLCRLRLLEWVLAQQERRAHPLSSRDGPTAPTAEGHSAATTSRPIHVATSSGSDGRACIICLDSEPPPIQSGCACRSDAGLAHVECRAMAAAHLLANSKQRDGWWNCGTCGQSFTAAMQLGLAEAWWSSAQRLPYENEQRSAADSILADALFNSGKYAKAETIFRELLAVQQRVLGPEHPSTLGAANNLANALHEQGKYAEAEAMLRKTLAVQQRVMGREHPETLMAASNLANTLKAQDKYVEAETISRELLAVQQRVMGREHLDTLGMADNLASTLRAQDKCAEAESMYREILSGCRVASTRKVWRQPPDWPPHSKHKASTSKQRPCTARRLQPCSECWDPSTRTR